MKKLPKLLKASGLVIVVIGLVVGALYVSSWLSRPGGGVFTSGPIMNVAGVSCAHTAGASLYGRPAGGAAADTCLIGVTNTGTAEAAITGCTLNGRAETFAGAAVTVPAGTNSTSPVVVDCGPLMPLTPDTGVTGSLVVEYYNAIPFSAMVEP